MGVLEKQIFANLLSLHYQKTFNVHDKQKALSYSEVEDSSCPKITYIVWEGKTQMKIIVKTFTRQEAIIPLYVFWLIIY